MFKKIVSFFRWVLILFFASSIGAVVAYKYLPVPCSPLMLIRLVQQVKHGEKLKLKHDWVPLEGISPHLPLAVWASEDQKFFDHSGFDLDEIKNARKEAERGKRRRGASTISQQTAKNVFTFGSPTIIRKGLEAWWTFLIEMIWGKERIIEVYLNVVEMGQGVYGMQTASKKYFGLTADELSAKESVCLAVCLPAPLTCSPFQLTRKEIRRRNRLIASIRQ